ncbi:MAG: metal-dependent hydrolase [Myxococcota bacterium]
MPSSFSHAAVALALAPAFWRPGAPRRIWVLGALAAAAPDLDVAGLRLGIEYGDPLGHRGFTHSLVFAALLATALARLALPDPLPAFSRARAWLYLFLATASHGLLDMLTDGGLGVALFSPFDNARVFFAFRPIAVSPLGARAFFGPRGIAVLKSELLWVCAPASLFAASCLALHRRWR